MKKIAVALGGGGSKGLAHIGVLKALHQNGISISAIAGTSIGSIIGAMAAKGYTPDEMVALFKEVDQSRLFGVPFSDGPGFLGYRGIKDLLAKVLGEVPFTDLKIPFSAISVDLVSDSVVEISEGSVRDAVLASIAIPGIFPPRYIGDMVLVDGGVMDPVPVRSARNLQPGIPVLAVSLTGKYRLSQLSPIPMREGNISTILVEQFSRTTLSKAFTVMADAVDTTSRQVAELRLQLDRPDIIIRPKVEKFGILDPVNVEEVVSLGYDATMQQLDTIKKSGNAFFDFYKKLIGEK